MKKMKLHKKLPWQLLLFKKMVPLKFKRKNLWWLRVKMKMKLPNMTTK